MSAPHDQLDRERLIGTLAALGICILFWASIFAVAYLALTAR